MKHELKLHDEIGSFAANGTLGNQLRIAKVEPHWEESEMIILNFDRVDSMTDSFVNAFVGNIAEAHPEHRNIVHGRNVFLPRPGKSRVID